MSQYAKLYMRPNLDNHGSVPAKNPLCSSPDIWVAGDLSIPDYRSSLITPDSYYKDCRKSLVYRKDNYIYVRGKNGNETANATNNVTLYYAEASAIQWPSGWQKNKIGTDQGPDQKGQIVKLKPLEIGVVDRPFVWSSVPSQPSNSHYCLIAQFNDDHNSNPFPRVDTCLDMAKLVQENLQWGWRNVTVCDNKENIVFSYQTTLSFSLENETERIFLVGLIPSKEFVGFQVSFNCSVSSSIGEEILLKKTTVTQAGQLLGAPSFTLKPGFNGLISVYAYSEDKKTIPKGARLTLESDYYASLEELKAGNALHLFDRELTDTVRKKMSMDGEDIGSHRIVHLGNYTGVIEY